MAESGCYNVAAIHQRYQFKFPAFSSELKRILSVSQLRLINLASASDAGKLLGWISGIAAAISRSGLSTSYVGLSAKLYTSIVDVVAPTSAAERAKVFVLLNSVLPLIVCTVAAPLARDVDGGKSRKLTKGFSTMFVITIVTGLFAVITSLGSVGSSLCSVCDSCGHDCGIVVAAGCSIGGKNQGEGAAEVLD
ncbi:hypothetical protein Sango_0347400 [Sesamum angolense]|uniref:Nodulin-like domain-containing protein n=1 Tax=Sesamum angolense TaxID=2727404 RepID=A0AAE1X9A0_9LAMI|nr:hypothetical protein Sango_0347400 [Sesamum angolense]